LLYLASQIQKKLQVINGSAMTNEIAHINFHPAGKRPSPIGIRRDDFGLLASARDWVCDFDLPELHSSGSKYHVPYEIDLTNLRCDGYIFSLSNKVCIIVELTVPMEDNIEYWHQFKTDKAFSDVIGWKIYHVALEIGYSWPIFFPYENYWF